MKKLLTKILLIGLLSNYLFKGEQAKSLVPYYYFPTESSLKKESLSISNNAYQLLYFGKIKESLNLAKLAIGLNKSNEKLWLILSETQLANNLFTSLANGG